MATLSTTSLNWLARQWEDQYKSAVLSGIVGDLAHKARGGYHISRQDQGSGNYSVTRPDDKGGPSDRAAAIDMTMSTADIKKCHVRLRDIWKNRAKDPRMKYINAWNGWDGEGGAGRYDVVKGTVGSATSDHKWHIHLEVRRRYVNDMTAMKAILSMLKGESLATYQGVKPPVVTTPKPTTPVVTKPTTPVVTKPAEKDDDGMAEITQARFNELFLAAISDPKISPQLKARAWQYVGGGIDEGKSTLGVFNEIHQLTKAVAATIAAESTNPVELEAALAGLGKAPTAEQNADAVVNALGGLAPEQLADILVNVLGAERAAALKAAL